MPARRSPTVRRRRLGLELRMLREQASLTIDQVATALECSLSKVSRIETGHVKATPRDVRDMLELYRVNGVQRDELIQLARDARERGWWTRFGDSASRIELLVGLETEATRVSEFHVLVVPGLLQTREYAEAIFRAFDPELDDDAIQPRVELRLARQEILEQDQPLQLHVILDESVLRRSVGGRKVMREQLEHLLERARWPNIKVQVLPFDRGEHTAILGSFTLLRFEPAGRHPDVVYIETEADDLYLEQPDELRRYTAVFDRLQASALDAIASRQLIQRFLR